MRTSRVSWILFSVLAAQASAAPRLDESIVKGADTYRKAVLAGNAQAVAATYREDAIEMPPCRPAVKGREAIEQYYRGLFGSPMKITAFTFSFLEAAAAGNSGYAAGTYERTISGASAGPVVDSGKFVVVVKRTDNEWKTAYAIYNSDREDGMAASPAAAVAYPQHDFALLVRNYAELARGWLRRFAILALAVSSVSAIPLIYRSKASNAEPRA